MNFCPLVHIWHKNKKGNKNKMKAKKWMITLCACSLATALLTGCGNNAESTNGNVQIDHEQGDETDTSQKDLENIKDNFRPGDEKQDIILQVTAIDGNQITATAMRNNRGQRPDGEAPVGENGEMPERPEGKNGERPEGGLQGRENGELPDGDFPGEENGEVPNGENTEGERPEKPKGDVSGDNPERQKRENITFTITEDTVISQESESGTVDATADQITTDSLIQVEMNENMEAVSIVIKTMPETK